MSSTKKTFSNPEISAFCTQMALILKSGLSAAEGISVLGADAGSDMQDFFAALSASLEQGLSLGQAMQASGRFPAYACDLTEIGVLSGRTDEIMESLAAHYEREEETASAIRSAVAYPLIMIGMMLAVILILITKVLPVFNQVFMQLGSGLTGFSRGLMDIGNLISRYSAAFVLFMALLAVFVFWLSKSCKGLVFRQKLFYLFPPVRRLSQKLSTGRFASGLAIALSSGLSMEEGLQMARRLSSDPVVSRRIAQCLNAYRSGASLSEAISGAALFSGLYTRMLSVGSQAGATEQVLQKISEQYASESEEQLSRMVSVLEPTLVAILSCIVGLILLSVMLPLLGIMSGVAF